MTIQRLREGIGFVGTTCAAIALATVVVGAYLNAWFVGGYWWRAYLHRGDGIGLLFNGLALLLGPFAMGRRRWIVLAAASLALVLRVVAHLAE